ncbi:hypothetical protein, partial [Salmonella enterica]|uniref:hypothetical protein n=1 Tax=Salmonella enterica TaxID=28901 RepID=UPI003299AE47
ITWEEDHKNSTNHQNKNVKYLTKNGHIRAKNEIRCFFTQLLCVQYHFNYHTTPYIYVTQIT